MTSVERLAKLAAPTGRRPSRRPSTVGDGDLCPLDAGHGAMVVLRLTVGQTVIDTARQYCPHVSHQPVGGPHERVSWPFDVTEGQLVELAAQERARLADLHNAGQE